MRRRSIAALAALALTAGCGAPAYVSPVEVTRFVGESDAYLAQGTITIEAAPGVEDSPAFETYRNAVRLELQRLGYREVMQQGGQVARVDLERYVVDSGERRSPVSVGGGASVGSYGSGVGLGVGIDLTGGPPERIETRLAVTIADADGGPNLWEGRAAMVATANSDFASDEAAAARMVQALFRDFPGRSGETISVE